MRKYGLPFRVGHHVASQIVSYAKAHNLKPTNFPYDQVKTIYSQVVKKEYPSAGPVCPMSEQEFKQTINPKSIIENRRTSGGPQKAELEKAVSRTDAVIEQNKKRCNKSGTELINLKTEVRVAINNTESSLAVNVAGKRFLSPNK